MAFFFKNFPTIIYDIEGKEQTNYDIVTNIFFRTRFLREVVNNISAYYEYIIQDGDTPEIIAEKVYRDPQAHWIVLYANDIVDAQYQWPLNSRAFQKYIINKYGSIQIAKTTIHHYEKVITRTDSETGIETETKFIINYEPLQNYELRSTLYVEGEDTFDIGETVYISPDATLANANFSATVESGSNSYYTLKDITKQNTATLLFGSELIGVNSSNVLTVAGSISPDNILYTNGSIFFNTGKEFDTYINLPDVQYVQQFNWGSVNNSVTSTDVFGKTVTQITRRQAVTNFEYEILENEAKRTIKIIKPEYLLQIMEEYNNITKFASAPFFRSLV